jgi:hypothetical protein
MSNSRVQRGESDPHPVRAPAAGDGADNSAADISVAGAARSCAGRTLARSCAGRTLALARPCAGRTITLASPRARPTMAPTMARPSAGAHR